MTDTTRRLLMTSLRLFDLAMLVAAFAVATCAVVANTNVASLVDFVSMRLSISNVAIILLVLVIASVIFSTCGLYQSKRLASLHLELTETVKATTIVTCMLMLFAIIFRIKMLTPTFVSTYWICLSFLTISGRAARRYGLGCVRRRGRNLRHILILGTNDRALDFARKIESRPELGYRLLGFVDSDWHGSAAFLQAGGHLCCNFDRAGRVSSPQCRG